MKDHSIKALQEVIKIDEAEVQNHLNELVRGSVEETLNQLLDAEAQALCEAEKYERSSERKDSRAGYYQRGLETKAGKVTLKVPKLRKNTFETAIIERYKRRESSVEEALMEMYLAGVNEEGYRKVLGIAEGAKEDKAGWSGFLSHLKGRGLTGVRLFISDACRGLVEALDEHYPETKWQRCVVHFYRNVFSHTPRHKMREVTALLKAIHAQEDLEAALEKAAQVIKKLEAMKLPRAANLVKTSIRETLSYYAFPSQHWRNIRTNNPLERVMREIRRRTKVVGAFPDGHSALILSAARLRHIAGTQWGSRKYVNMQLLKQQEVEQAIKTA